jgi:hypothetical protein
MVFRRPSFFEPLRRLFSGKVPFSSATLGSALVRQAFGEYTLSISPGYVRP